MGALLADVERQSVIGQFAPCDADRQQSREDDPGADPEYGKLPSNHSR